MHLLPLFICTIVLLNSCAGGIPDPIDFPQSEQQKMQASHHWDVLAKDLANRINNELIITDNIESTVFVKQTCGNESKPCEPHQTSSFNEAFRDLLITNLVDFGIPTRNQLKDDSIEIQYKVQIVHHNAKRIRAFEPGVLTAISAAIVVLRNAPAEFLILTAGVMADLANANLTQNGHYEIIITTSMVSQNKYLFRASDIYYINDKDFYHYRDVAGQTKTIQLSTPPPKSRASSVPANETDI
ncbi:MAG: hypothetical protein KAI39_02050 [Desulfobulbaceae bacterium]|nr:hypothetical protein [Desulfobulbaceae bacterium]